MVNKGILNLLREVRGTAKPGDPAFDGIHWELTQKLLNGHPGIYGDILAMHNEINSNSDTVLQASDLIGNLRVEVTELDSAASPTSVLEGTVIKLGIPKGYEGRDGLTPKYSMAYNATTGYLEQIHDGYVDSDAALLTPTDLDALEDNITNLSIQLAQVRAELETVRASVIPMATAL